MGFNSFAKYLNTLLPLDTHFFTQKQTLHEFLLLKKFKILNIWKQEDIGGCNLKINILDVNLDTYMCTKRKFIFLSKLIVLKYNVAFHAVFSFSLRNILATESFLHGDKYSFTTNCIIFVRVYRKRKCRNYWKNG